MKYLFLALVITAALLYFHHESRKTPAAAEAVITQAASEEAAPRTNALKRPLDRTKVVLNEVRTERKSDEF